MTPELKELLNQYSENAFGAFRAPSVQAYRSRKAELEEQIASLFSGAEEAGAAREREECVGTANEAATRRNPDDSYGRGYVDACLAVARTIEARVKVGEKPYEGEAARSRNCIHDINLFLNVARERLDCLKEYDCVDPCDALDALDEHLNLALGLTEAALEKTKPFDEIRKELTS